MKTLKEFVYESLITESKEGIFTGAVWDSDENQNMVLRVTGNKVYGCCDSFDFERNSKEEAYQQLKKWGFRYIGVD